MFKQVAYSSVIAATLLIAPTTKIFAQAVATPSAVTGGDPQPTAESTIVLLSMIPSLAVL